MNWDIFSWRRKMELKWRNFPLEWGQNFAILKKEKRTIVSSCCRGAGEDEESDDENAFNKKSVWARMSVILAGPIFNFILAFVLAIFVSSIAGVNNNTLKGITENSGAEQAGLQAGDEIIKLNNTKIHIFEDISLFLQTHPNGEAVQVTYERDGVKQKVSVTPTKTEEGGYLFGFQSERTKGNPIEVIQYSFYNVIYY